MQLRATGLGKHRIYRKVVDLLLTPGRARGYFIPGNTITLGHRSPHSENDGVLPLGKAYPRPSPLPDGPAVYKARPFRRA